MHQQNLCVGSRNDQFSTLLGKRRRVARIDFQCSIWAGIWGKILWLLFYEFATLLLSPGLSIDRLKINNNIGLNQLTSTSNGRYMTYSYPNFRRKCLSILPGNIQDWMLRISNDQTGYSAGCWFGETSKSMRFWFIIGYAPGSNWTGWLAVHLAGGSTNGWLWMYRQPSLVDNRNA